MSGTNWLCFTLCQSVMFLLAGKDSEIMRGEEEEDDDSSSVSLMLQFQSFINTSHLKRAFILTVIVQPMMNFLSPDQFRCSSTHTVFFSFSCLFTWHLRSRHAMHTAFLPAPMATRHHPSGWGGGCHGSDRKPRRCWVSLAEQPERQLFATNARTQEVDWGFLPELGSHDNAVTPELHHHQTG